MGSVPCRMTKDVRRKDGKERRCALGAWTDRRTGGVELD